MADAFSMPLLLAAFGIQVKALAVQAPLTAVAGQPAGGHPRCGALLFHLFSDFIT
jgi:hypothetical protein